MKTLEIEIIIMSAFSAHGKLIVPCVSWGMGRLGGKDLHECDILVLSQSGYATEIEIKTSLPDLKKDRLKKHGHRHNHIKQLYFAVPEKLAESALELIPERAGLYVIKESCIETAKKCTRNKNAARWSDKERMKLAYLGASRILHLKSKISDLTDDIIILRRGKYGE